MALVRLYLENQNKAKHVESKLVPRLDEGSSPSSSTNTNTQSYKNVWLGVFYFRDFGFADTEGQIKPRR